MSLACRAGLQQLIYFPDQTGRGHIFGEQQGQFLRGSG